MKDSSMTTSELRIRNEAAGWFARECSGTMDARTKEELQRWLAADARHAAAYRRVTSAWNRLDVLDREPSVESMLRSARELPGPKDPQRRRLFAGMAASALAGTGIGYGVLRRHGGTQPQHWRRETGVGETAELELPDGSSIRINTQTRLEVAYSDVAREIWLGSGQALFRVAHDRSRPFRVHAAQQIITAVGTAFDVRCAEQDVVVTMLEGRVRFGDGSLPVDAEPTLDKGQQVQIESAAPMPVIRAADARTVTAWEHGLMVFDDDRLADVVREANRYSKVAIVIDNPQLADMRISGAFHTGHQQQFAEALELLLPVRSQTLASGELLLSLKSTPPGADAVEATDPADVVTDTTGAG